MSEGLPPVLGHYRINSLIGAGGMGEVYLGDDDKLGRRVAIKILPESVSRDEDARKRMLREARAVAAIDHPNVCTIFEVGEHESRPYIVMQYIDGETLFDRMRKRRLSLPEAIEIGIQVAAALDEAHRHGIVHRDIKPLNIMITARGQVKVLDFGLAKFNAPVEGSTEIMKSRAGVVTGTAPYMSPEQLRGTNVDARSDVFSLGVVLYEMATGKRPFDRDSTVATITAVLFEEPPPLDDEEFAPLAPIIRQALMKDPARRYATTAEILFALEEVKARPRSARRRLKSSELEATQTMESPVVPPSSSAKGRIDSLAVLPTVTGPIEAGLEYLVYGLSEGITNALSHVRRLRVIAPGTSSRYAGTEADPRQVGRELNVAAIVGVRARVEGENLHADVNLVHTGDGSIRWSARYSRPIREIASLSEAIADDIAERVRIRGASGPRRTVKKKRAVDPEAQQLFLKGRFQWIKRHPEALKQAMALFQQAVEIDPLFAMPYAGLADSFVMLGFIEAFPPRDILPKVKAAARRAIELEPTLADPHATLGYAAGLFEWDWETAQHELDEAMRLNENYPWAPHWLGVLMCGRGMTKKGLEYIELSRTLDPLSPIINVGVGVPYHVAGRFDEAVAIYRSVLDTNPSLAPGHYYLALTLHLRGDHDEAVEHVEKAISIAGPASLYLGALAHMLAVGGRRAEAEATLERLHGIAAQRYVSPYTFAIANLGLGRFDEALTALEGALEEHHAWMWFLPIDLRFDPLRADPRFAPLVERYGLPARVVPDTP